MIKKRRMNYKETVDLILKNENLIDNINDTVSRLYIYMNTSRNPERPEINKSPEDLTKILSILISNENKKMTNIKTEEIDDMFKEYQTTNNFDYKETEDLPDDKAISRWLNNQENPRINSELKKQGLPTQSKYLKE